MTPKTNYEKQIKNKIESIEKLQRQMNSSLNKPAICLKIEKRQSLLRVEIKFLKRKVEAIESRFNKAA